MTRKDRVGQGLSARRRRVAAVAVTGTGLLGASFAAEPNSTEFYGLTLATAASWALGGLRRNSGDDKPERSFVSPILIGVAAFAVFYGCGLVARRIPFLRKEITGVLRYAEHGSTLRILLITLANGAAEEIFFRGAVYSVAGKNPVLVSTGIYACSTVATRNPALVLASIVMGTLFGLQRRTTGSIQAPMLTHLTWSTLMLHYLPRLFRTAGDTHPVRSPVADCSRTDPSGLS